MPLVHSQHGSRWKEKEKKNKTNQKKTKKTHQDQKKNKSALLQTRPCPSYILHMSLNTSTFCHHIIAHDTSSFRFASSLLAAGSYSKGLTLCYHVQWAWQREMKFLKLCSILRMTVHLQNLTSFVWYHSHSVKFIIYNHAIGNPTNPLTYKFYITIT